VRVVVGQRLAYLSNVVGTVFELSIALDCIFFQLQLLAVGVDLRLHGCKLGHGVAVRASQSTLRLRLLVDLGRQGCD